MCIARLSCGQRRHEVQQLLLSRVNASIEYAAIIHSMYYKLNDIVLPISGHANCLSSKIFVIIIKF